VTQYKRNTIEHLDEGDMAEYHRWLEPQGLPKSPLLTLQCKAAEGRMQRGAQYGCFIFTWPHSLTPANVSALRKSLKIIKKLLRETDCVLQCGHGGHGLALFCI